MSAVFSFFVGLWDVFYSMKPSYISRKPKFNFIDVHGAWILVNSLLSAMLLMIGSKIKFIDALFMGAGASTQSGLNTVDVNSLSTFQQIILYLFPMWTNPIIINTFVAALRRFWFERRMKDVVASARQSRRTIGRTLSRSRVRDAADEERGINGRRIVVMHNESRPVSGVSAAQVNDFAVAPVIKEEINETEVTASTSSDSSKSGMAGTSASEHDSDHEHGHPLRPQITFAEQPKPVHPEHGKMSANISADIAAHPMLRRLQTKDPDAVLRIPSPRDAEMGAAPRAVQESDQLTRPLSRGASIYSRASAPENENHSDIPTMPRRGITIAEPLRPSESAAAVEPELDTTKHSFLRLRRPSWARRGSKEDKEENADNGADLHRIRSRISTITSFFKSPEHAAMPYLSWDPTIGRNSAFADMTEDQREELGGIEYRALKLLVKILVAYFLGFTLFGIICLMPWIMRNSDGGDVVRAAGAGRPWWAVYTSSSAFNDVGYTLTPDSMVSFRTAKWPLVLLSYLVVIGNTGFPIMLRVSIWLFSKVVPKESSVWEELNFLLDHPRRCFTLLFPSSETWTLFWILCGLNGLDLLLYVVLDLNTAAVTDVPINIRVLNGWFQAVSTRTAGFAVVDLSALHPSVQISYLIMMYISIFPIAISVRRTNVYEEKSLGVYNDPNEEDVHQPSYIGSHLRRQLSYDLWYIFLGFFIISIAEGNRLGDDSVPRFSMFALLFEIVSAYGTVGLSLGYPNRNQSFSVELKTLSKLVIIAMEIRGRHRGLPYALDRAIMLPSEKRQLEEEQEAAVRIQRRMSMNSTAPSIYGGPLSRIRTKSSERGRTGPSIFGSLLGPGPAVPIHRRTINKDDPPHLGGNGSMRRRHSVGTTGMRARRESMDVESPRHQFFPSFFSGTNQSTAEAQPNEKTEGRRHFFQEGVNPEPKESETLPPKLEGKQA